MIKTSVLAFKYIDKELYDLISIAMKCVFIWRLGFYKCLHLLNMESVENRADNDEDFPISIPKDYFQTANEICYIGKKSLKKRKYLDMCSLPINSILDQYF